MRIDRLDLIAYGTFTNISLDLSGGGQGLHLIHGPNEAGKSTALRALRAWLFGFHTRSNDNFQHPYGTMRVGGVLRDQDGRTFESIRRKATKKSLRLGDDEKDADEDMLAATLLGGMTLDDFQSMMTIDSKTLSTGGGATLKAGGKLAELIFGSGLDLATLRTFQRSLEAEIDDLFKPKGQNQSINSKLKSLEEKQKEIDDAAIKGIDWTTRVEGLADLQERLTTTDGEWRRVGVERERLRRITQARPDLARRETLRIELASLAHIPSLADDFPERRKAAEQGRITATVQITARTEDAKRLQELLNALPPEAAIMRDADAIEAIQIDLGRIQEAERTRAKRGQARAEHLQKVTILLSELGREESPETAIAPRIKTGHKAKLASLSDQWNGLNANREATRRTLASARKKLVEANRKIADGPATKDMEGLRRVIERTRRIQDSADGRETVVRELSNLERQAKTLHARLGNGVGPLEEIVNWSVPSIEILERYRDEFPVVESAVNAAKTACRETEDRLAELRKQIERQRQESDVPDLSTLNTRRDRRDAGWRLVKAHWLGPEVDPESLRLFLGTDPAVDLSGAFEGAIRSADEIADRLRVSAAEVAARAGYLADQAHLVEMLEVWKTRRADAEADLRALQGRWSASWSGVGITPRTPREMITWSGLYTSLVEKIELITATCERLESIDGETTIAVVDLRREISLFGEECVEGEPLASARDRANTIVARSQAEASKKAQAEANRDEIERDVREASDRLAEFDEQAESWRKHWSAAVEPLGLGPEVTPSDAVAILDASSELAKHLEQVGRITSEILDAESVSNRFRLQLESLLAVHSPGTVFDSPEQAANLLKSLLNAARTNEERRKTLQAALEDAERAIQKANESLRHSLMILESLANDAGIDGIDGLAAIERLALDRAERERERRAVEDRLIAVAPGMTPDDLEIEARATSSEEIELVRALYEEDFARLDGERQDLNTQIGRMKQLISSMETTAKEAKAEAAATEREHLMGLLEADVDRYVHLRLSLAVLKGAIEEYRSQNEAPVLRRASEHFTRFTLGSFGGLRAEPNDSGDPVLYGFRPDGKTLVDVNGMSDGTVDQLYLAMKLASVEHYFRNRPTLPFIVDDILVQFDDARALAALDSLAELSKTTQVLFFTHHEHLVKLAAERLPNEVLFVHRLAGQRTPAASSA